MQGDLASDTVKRKRMVHEDKYNFIETVTIPRSDPVHI